MGLGKTLSVIGLVSTLLHTPALLAIKKHPLLQEPVIFRVLVVAPVSTLQNWVVEFRRWPARSVQSSLRVRLVASGGKAGVGAADRMLALKLWHTEGGVCVIGYDLFRRLAGAQGRGAEDAGSAQARRYLLDPGPDVVVADEAHTIKNRHSQVCELLGQMATRRRIALTGSPLQNNLEEYWCMVDFVRRQYLGTLREFRARFINPISEGENKDASRAQVPLYDGLVLTVPCCALPVPVGRTYTAVLR